MNKENFNVMRLIFGLIGVICIGIAIYGLSDVVSDYKEAEDIYEEAEKEFVEIFIPVDISTEDSTEPETTVPEEPKIPWYEIASVDVASLQTKYKDVVGWILFEDGLISYPVMQGKDNDQYLHTAYNGVESFAGSIFVDAAASGDFTDGHTIIYGHNMKNLSMFGRLKHFVRRPGYYDVHKYFQIFVENEIWRYEIFAYQEVSIDSFVYQEECTSVKEFAKRLKKGSYVNSGISVTDEDKIITLSTCTTNEKRRLVVSAVLIEKYSLTDKTLIEAE